MYVRGAVCRIKMYACFLFVMQIRCVFTAILARQFMCGSVCFCLYRAYAHCICCEAMHACVGVCVWACTRRMLTVIVVRQCMHVLAAYVT
jgi:hypothetical protein